MRGSWTFVVVAGLVFAAGCSSLPPVLSWEPPHIGDKPLSVLDEEQERAYQQILARYTDRGELYAKLDTRAFVATTIQTWPFREARVRRTAAFQKLPPAELERRLAAEKAEAEAGQEFFVAFHSDDYRFDDLDKKTSVWRIALLSGTQETTPAKVERIGRANLDLRALYPYLDEFWTAYRVQFPKQAITEGAEKVTLRLASTLGAADLDVAAR